MPSPLSQGLDDQALPLSQGLDLPVDTSLKFTLFVRKHGLDSLLEVHRAKITPLLIMDSRRENG